MFDKSETLKYTVGECQADIYFFELERLLMSLMILFLYKCIKVVVINILKCVYVQPLCVYLL